METEEICWESQKGKERETDVEREKGGQGGRQRGGDAAVLSLSLEGFGDCRGVGGPRLWPKLE